MAEIISGLISFFPPFPLPFLPSFTAGGHGGDHLGAHIFLSSFSLALFTELYSRWSWRRSSRGSYLSFLLFPCPFYRALQQVVMAEIISGLISFFPPFPLPFLP